jgi:anti-sigma B factor antagonist
VAWSADSIGSGDFSGWFVCSSRLESDVSHRLRMPSLALSVQPAREHVVVVVGGEIDLATVDDLTAAVAELREDGWDDIVLDLRGVEFLDSTGLGWLYWTAREARDSGWALSLVDGSPAVSRLLRLTGMRHHFRWTDTPPRPDNVIVAVRGGGYRLADA